MVHHRTWQVRSADVTGSFMGSTSRHKQNKRPAAFPTQSRTKATSASEVLDTHNLDSDSNNSKGKDGTNDDNNGSSKTSNVSNSNGATGGNSNNSKDYSNNFGPPNCQFVNENDGRLQYTGLWVLETKDPRGLTTTTHTTTTAGSQVVISFNGTSIIVVGIVHSNSGSKSPAVATYVVDSEPSITLPLPAATHDIPNQQFFQSSTLQPGDHTLTINITSNGSPYTLDYLFFCGDNDSATSSSSPTSSPTPPAPAANAVTQTPPSSTETSVKKPPKTTAIVVGSVLGMFMLILLLLLALMLLRCRRRRSRAARTASSPLKDWIQRQTLFTSSESILRNNPSNPSTIDPKEASSEYQTRSVRNSIAPSNSGTSFTGTVERSSKTTEPPIYRTYAEFERNWDFYIDPYQIGVNKIPYSPNGNSGIDGRKDLSPHPPLPKQLPAIPV
ncbi:hypothetical protein ABKN59_010526 [Abortiporus biennis]